MSSLDQLGYIDEYEGVQAPSTEVNPHLTRPILAILCLLICWMAVHLPHRPL